MSRGAAVRPFFKPKCGASGLFAFAALGLVTPSTQAFAPGGFAQFPASKTHTAITEDGLQTIYGELGLTKVSQSMKAARKQIAEANREVDQDQFSSSKHFDGENFVGGQTWVNGLLAQVVVKIQAQDAAGARVSLGSALHTVQDFYAHTNWVELGLVGPSAELGRPGAISNTAPPTEASCVDAPFYNASCFKNNLTTAHLTSGYYGGEDRVKPGNKCRHGGFFDSSPGRGGIAKDSRLCTGVFFAELFDSGHNDAHPAASAVATRATEQVLRDLRGKMSEQEFKALLGVGPSLGFAMDTTGSMGSIIAGVRSTAVSMVDTRLGTDQEPSKYVLSSFNDPFVAPVFVTSNSNTFKAAINGLSASGGGDCPELAMQGTLNAVDASDEGGSVFLFTDASAKDASLVGAVRAVASSKKVRIFPALFGSCSPYDPAYFSLANSSGGQVFILSVAEANKFTQLADLLARNDAVDMDLTQGTVTVGTPQNASFVVDTQTKQLTVSFSQSDAAQLTLRRPDGRLLTASDADVKTVTLSQGLIYSVTTPAAGRWQTNVSGTGDYSLLVSGESSLVLDEFSFVEQSGRPGHLGYYPIAGLPVIGRPTKAMARFSGNPQNVSFEYRDLSGHLVSTFALNETDPAPEPNHLVGTVSLPSANVRLYAVGQDASGAPFQRLLSTVVSPQTLAVTPPTVTDLGQGQATTFVFEVKNEGPAGTFEFVASDTQKWVSSTTPTSAMLNTGQAINVKVALLTPVSAVVGTRDTLTLNGRSAVNPENQNFAVLTTSVVAPKRVGDVNRDGMVDCADLDLVKSAFGSRAGSRSFSTDVDVDANGVIDVRDLAFVARQLPVGTVCP